MVGTAYGSLGPVNTHLMATAEGSFFRQQGEISAVWLLQISECQHSWREHESDPKGCGYKSITCRCSLLIWRHQTTRLASKLALL